MEQKRVLLKAPKEYSPIACGAGYARQIADLPSLVGLPTSLTAAAPLCARSSGAGMTGKIRLLIRFFLSRLAWRSRLTALRFAPRISGGRAVTGPPLYRSHAVFALAGPAERPLFSERGGRQGSDEAGIDEGRFGRL